MVELSFKAGDSVRLRLADKEIDVRILESPESEIVLVKLESGYNIGIRRENILAARKLPEKTSEQLGEEEREKDQMKISEGKPSIGLIITGGTIAAKLNPKTGGAYWLADIDEFAKFYPEMFECVNVKKIEIPFMTSSEAMTSEHWIKIAKAIKPMLDDPEIKGVIVTHGTDFLHYTSAALSFFFKNLNKPIVLTYSQRSIDRASSDATLNLQCAARMAISDAAEVMLVGHASTNDNYCHALRGTKVRKLHTSIRSAFKPVNTQPIAKVYPDKIEYISKYKPRNGSTPEIDTSFTDKVALIKFYPGQDPSILDFYALKYKGVVIEVGGLGHLPPAEAQHNWIPVLKKHIRAGLVVCAAAQTIYGRLNPYVYSNGRELVDAGVIFLEDMLAETALIKLGHILGHPGWKTKAKEKMLENVAGELESFRSL